MLEEKQSLWKTSKDVCRIRELYLTAINFMYTEEAMEKQTNGLWFRVILKTPNIYSFKYAKRLAEEKEALKDIIWAVITESLREVLC